jgi:hypothetical protein
MNVESSGAPWIYRALNASIPYANLIILNLGQAIVAVFLSSEFMKADRKNDTVEVIYVRSMSNGDYILGKTFGILMVFVILNIIVLSLSIGLSFISSITARGIMPLLIYPLFISLPTLVYILGLSFFVMLLLKNQAITFIILLGYIAVSVFYLNHRFYHVFDFIAYYVPMMHSSFGDFGNLREILVHRGIYLFAGISFIFFTIYKLNRLPQSKWFNSLPLIIALVFITGSGLLSWSYISSKEGDIAFKKEVVDLNNQCIHLPKATVKNYTIAVEHYGNRIKATSSMVIYNEDTTKIDTLIFSLNPNLKLNSVLVNSIPAKFQQQIQIIKIPYTKGFIPGDSLSVEMNYNGTIDERVCFVDLNSLDEKDNFYLEVFNMRKRYAWVTSDFVCLNPSALWYPIAGVGYATFKPLFNAVNMAYFHLKVKTGGGLTAVSQGNCKSDKKGTFEFSNSYQLPSISLLIGNYKKYSVTVDSVTYNLFTKIGNEYFEPYFKNIKDTIPALIRELKQDYEKTSRFSYPFKSFSLVEVPVHFALDNHVWAFSSDAVQPEMILYPEKGVSMWDADFRFRRFREEKGMKKNNEEVSPKELQVRMFKQVFRKNLLRQADDQNLFNGVITTSTYSVFPCYFSFSTPLQSHIRPELTIGFESYLNDRNVTVSKNKRNFWEDLSPEEWIITKLKKSSLEELVKTTMSNEKEALKTPELRKIVLAKGRQFFDIIESKYGKNLYDSAINQIIDGKKHEIIPFSKIETVFRKNFGLNLNQELNSWYSEKNLPGFVISDIQSYKVVKDEKTVYQIKFIVSNLEKSDGCFIVNIEIKDPKRNKEHNLWETDAVVADFSRKYFIPANSARQLGFIFPSEPARMSIYTFISQNLPNVVIFDYNGFDELRRDIPLDTIIAVNTSILEENKREIIVDNEDSGFEIMQSDDQPFLKRLIQSNDKKEKQYSFVRFWAPPSQWTPSLRTEFYGRYIHSVYYTKGGQGDKKVIWKAHLPEKTQYDVYCYLPQINTIDKKGQRTDYNYVIHSDEGEQKVSFNFNDVEKGWYLLGTYYISADTAKVELSNKTRGSLLFADAVKWVKTK